MNWEASVLFFNRPLHLFLNRYQEAKKNKHKKANTEEDLDFPKHEKIKFGDVVEAPLKLLAVPKVTSNCIWCS